MDDFHSMSHYAPEDTDTKVKRKAKFLKGLSDELKILLSVAYAPNYPALLDPAIILDDNIKKAESRKRKMGINKHHSEPSYKKHFAHDGNHGHKHGNHTGGNFHKHGHNHNGGFKGTNGIGRASCRERV